MRPYRLNRGIGFASIVLCILGFMWGESASASIHPSFSLTSLAWDASHIVVVSEGDEIDGKLEVLESWRGDLVPGSKLELPELAEFADPETRKVNSLFTNKDAVTQVSGYRMIVFLKKDVTDGWLPPTYWGGFKVCVVWVEGGIAYAYQIRDTDSPPSLLPIESEFLIKVIISEVTVYFEALEKAEHEANPILATQVLKTSNRLNSAVPLSRPNFKAMYSALRTLESIGEKALPQLRILLDDEELAELHESIEQSIEKIEDSEIN